MLSSKDVSRYLFGLASALLGVLASANEPCRVVFDMGSSGIRAGASNSEVIVRADIDYLGSLSAGRGLEETIAPTIAALVALPRQAGFSDDCARLGGGFSAWRIALQQDAGNLASNFARIKAASGVAVLVIPQRAEGAYGYVGARQLLGSRLATSHVLDIGGGSLQIAGERAAFGDALGQKIWHRELCQLVRNASVQPCQLQPMSDAEVAEARALLKNKLRGVQEALQGPVTMTAISRPVTQGVVPAVERLLDQHFGQNPLPLSGLRAAIGRLVSLTLDETVARLGMPSKYAAYLLSDMLLLEGLMDATGGEPLHIAELDLTNLPGLLADEHAFGWVGRYDCYLERLKYLGLQAYASDPATCRAAGQDAVESLKASGE
jgi:hypothetical protein